MILFSNEILTNVQKNKWSPVRLNANSNEKPYVCFSFIHLAAPDVVVRTVDENWEFILLACDGIWDVLSNEEVLKFVRTRVAQQMPPELVIR